MLFHTGHKNPFGIIRDWRGGGEDEERDEEAAAASISGPTGVRKHRSLGFLSRRGHAGAAVFSLLWKCRKRVHFWGPGPVVPVSEPGCGSRNSSWNSSPHFCLFVPAPQAVLWKPNLFISGLGVNDPRLRKWEPAEVLACFKDPVIVSISRLRHWINLDLLLHQCTGLFSTLLNLSKL